MHLFLVGHVQINHVNSREVRLRAHHHHGSRGQILMRPGSAVFDAHTAATSSGGSATTGNGGPAAAAAANHEQVGR